MKSKKQKAKKTMKIYHLSDLHIRAGCNAKARVGEYAFVFARFVAWLRGQDGLDKSMVVITGDLFHHKSRIESPGIKLFYDFLQGLARVGLGGGVVVIRGNHDYKQWDREDEVDLIGSLMIPGILGVRYMNETGVEVVEFGGGGGGGEIELGVLAIQDFSLQGDTVAANRVVPEAMPDFPRPSGERGRKKVALFHGAVPSTLVAARNFFVGYDVALLGDVHAQQVWGEGKRIAAAAVGPEAQDDQVEGLWAKTIDGFTYGYAGSMIRQNMGEPIKGHGFLVWDLDLGLVTAFHIKNPVEFGDVRALETELQKQIPNLKRIAMGDGEGKGERVEGDGDGEGKGEMVEGDGEGKGEEKEAKGRNPCVQYLLAHGGDETMAGFVLRPETLLLPSVFQGSDNAVIEAKAGERQGKITKRLEAYCDSVGNGVGGPGGSFRLVLARWDYILCYGGGNVFDFGKLDGKINILAARNGHGKTSFLEMILLGLYGTGFPSRTNKLRTASVIGLTKPPKTACQVVLTVRIGSGDLFRITRQFNRQEDAKRLHVNVKATLVERRNEEGDGWTGYLSGKTAVDKWVVANVGPMSSFLLSCMVSQNADADFFSLSAADQKELLDTAINVESHTRFMELVKESRLAHMAISDLIGVTAGVLAKGIGALPDVVGTGERLALLEKWIGEGAGSGFGRGGGFGGWAGAGAGAGAKLEGRGFYENIVRGGGAADVADLEKQLAELRTLKTNAAKTGGGAKKPLEWYVKELAELDEEPVDDVTKEPVASYDPKAFAAAAAAFEAASDAMPGDLEPDHGFDTGPYNEACACCREKKLECAFLNAARVYAAHIRAKRGYLQGCIATLKTSQLAELEAGLNQARRKQAEFEKAAAILERYDEIAAGQKMTDWLLERQRLRDAVDRRLAMAADMNHWLQTKKVVDERATLFGSIFKIMDGYVAWMYNDSVLPRVSKCTNQVMSLVDPALKLRGTVGADGFEWTLATGLGAEDQAPPIEKASGFQRFLCGLAVRIALGGIGAAGIKPRQLFLDEGFTSCDQTNLAKVPEMLQTLLQLYDSIVLVTHLEDLKDAAGDSTIEIKRDEEKGTSRLVF